MYFATVFQWHGQFSTDRELFDNQQTNRRLSTTKTNKIIDRISAVLNEHQSAGCRLIELVF